MTQYVGVAPLTAVRTARGQRVNTPAGALIPETADTADVSRLLAEGYIAALDEVEEELETVADAAAPVDVHDPVDILKGKVGDILDHVGDDATLAAALLEVETSEDGQGRATLVKGLEEAIAASRGDS